MRHWLLRLEVLSAIFGIFSGAATAIFDVYVLSNEQVPLSQLNADIIYPIFFQIALFALLVNMRRFFTKNLFIATTFFITACLISYVMVFFATPPNIFMPRFLMAFPNQDIGTVLLDSSISRLTWSFVLMLMAMAMARLARVKRRQA